MTEAERLIGYEFKTPALLSQALTHPSFGGDYHVPHYQRLEFLGDAVLELYVSEALYRKFPDEPEGKLTRMRADLVCEASLSEALRRLDLQKFIRLSVGETRSGGQDKPSIQCDILESVIGAIYLDGGRKCAGEFIERAIGEKLRSDSARNDHLDYKSRLQAIMQAAGGMPVYELISSSGPAHAPVFEYRVLDGDTELGRGSGSSKQAAQLEAARDALNRQIGEK